VTGYVANIEQLTRTNTDFRHVLYSAPHLQLVLMALQPGEEIGTEIHVHTDQFFRIEMGEGEVEIDGVKHRVTAGAGIIVPAGARHNLSCTGELPLHVYTIYSPPHHQDRLVQSTRAEADASVEKYNGVLSDRASPLASAVAAHAETAA
jgi:mannose-6-phosphate isomerase-like protein (cupin superfamily)